MRLAARGRRDLDGGPEAVEDSTSLAEARRTAVIVHAKAFVAALLLTAAAFLLPTRAP